MRTLTHTQQNRRGHKEAIIALHLAVGALQQVQDDYEKDPEAYPEWENVIWDAEGIAYSCELYAGILEGIVCGSVVSRERLRQLEALGFPISERLTDMGRPLAERIALAVKQSDEEALPRLHAACGS